MKRIMILLCSCFIVLCSCKDEVECCDEGGKVSFESQSSMGAYVQTDPAFLYDKFRHQKSIGNDFYRIQTDTQDTCLIHLPGSPCDNPTFYMSSPDIDS